MEVIIYTSAVVLYDYIRLYIFLWIYKGIMDPW